ncbi:MAG: LytTR family DNA-binding domain-containing protein [Gammaproteobacteria bacterium]|nr:LytTR family DNA-binding domain-containing protein [Gammaproteobacteria bacterium]
MKILIVDDEKPARDRLSRMVGELDSHELVGEAVNGLEALGMAQSLEPDIVLLDIRMPGMDGIEAARHIAKLDEPPAVIFVTAFSDHALEAFETHAVDYLLKPVKQERLQTALDATIRPTRAQASRSNGVLSELETRQHICARVRGSLVLVPIENIYYFHAEQKYVTVRHTEGEVLIEDALKGLESEFGDRFYRIHRNALVSLSRLAGMQSEDEGQRVTFRDIDDTLEVSRRHLPGVRKIIRNL